VHYQFLLAAHLSGPATAAFPELRTGPGPTGGTTLWGRIDDDSHLATVLARFADLGLTVVELRQIPH
jgi:hypothetical protein